VVELYDDYANVYDKLFRIRSSEFLDRHRECLECMQLLVTGECLSKINSDIKHSSLPNRARARSCSGRLSGEIEIAREGRNAEPYIATPRHSSSNQHNRVEILLSLTM
jgi:hypothetical protein